MAVYSAESMVVLRAVKRAVPMAVYSAESMAVLMVEMMGLL